MPEIHYYIIVLHAETTDELPPMETEIFHSMDDLVRHVKKNFDEETARKLIPEDEFEELTTHSFENECIVLGYKHL